jgi:ankyrin repeat protein
MWEIVESDPKIIQLIKQFIQQVDKGDQDYACLDNTIQVLIEPGNCLSVDDTDRLGKSALYYAIEAKDVKLVAMLLDKGADINLPDAHGVTPLWIAACNGYAAIVEILLGHDAEDMRLYEEINLGSDDFSPDVPQTIADYASPQEYKIIACFTLALLASLAIAALGVLAVCGISCSWVICLDVAIVSCIASLVFLHLLDKQNTQRQEIKRQEITSESTEDNSGIGQTDKTSRHKCLVGACVVLHISAVVSAAFCPPLCLVLIGILSISLLGIKFFCRTPNEMPEIMKEVNGKSK